MEHPDLFLDNIKEENVDIEIKQEEVSFEIIEEEESCLSDEIKEETVLKNEIKEEDNVKENTNEIYQSKMMEFLNVKAEEEIDNVCTEPPGHEADPLALITTVETTTKKAKRGRPSSDNLEQMSKKKRGPQHPLPTSDVRKDGVDHWPVFIDNRIRCKHPDCNRQTFIICEKCNVGLCLNRNQNCFKEYHTR